MQRCGCNDVAVMLFAVLVLLLVRAHDVSGTPVEFLGGNRKLANWHKQRRVPKSPHFLLAQQFSSSAAISTIILSDGDVVSCIPINQQPALLSSPNMNIQLKPSTSPKAGAPTTDSSGSRTASQVFGEEVGSCPNGTIPLRNLRGSGSKNKGLQTANAGDQFIHEGSRTQCCFTTNSCVAVGVYSSPYSVPVNMLTKGRLENRNAMQCDSLEVSKYLPAASVGTNPRILYWTSYGAFIHSTNLRTIGLTLLDKHAFTATPIAHPPSYKGTEVLINVWQPFVEPHDFSLAQLWVMNTGLSYPPTSVNWALNTVEVGWQVYSDFYGDNRPRLFIYWTGDGYDKTGCYNLNQDCVGGTPGFVQVSNKVLIGGSIAPPSAIYSQQYEIKLRVFKFNDENVGYWPSSLFHSLKDTSDLIEWGGEIIHSLGGSNHTTTNMGSGELPSLGYKKAAYQRNLQYVGEDDKLYDIKDLQAMAESSSCYAVTTGSNKLWGTYFYYGGRCH